MMESPQPSTEDLTRPDASNPPNPLSPDESTEISQLAESRTREYLSNERTYLSWLRTAISLLGISAILGRIHSARPPLAPKAESTWQLGIIFATAGLITVLLATQHYLSVRREIANNCNEVTERWVIVFSIAAILSGSGILYYVLTYTPIL
jgi:putative membrane protein